MRILSPIASDLSWSAPRVFTDFDRMVDALLTPVHAASVNFQTGCDVSETDEHYLVSFDMPGVKKDDIKIEVVDRSLSVTGERRSPGGGAYGKFERTFTMPQTIDTAGIEALYEDGVLKVALPKAESAKPRTVQIQSGAGGIFSKLLGAKKEQTKDINESKSS